MTTEDKLLKLRKLADAMYYAAQYLTTDASRLHKAMDEYHQFIIHEYHKEEPTIPYIIDEHWWEMLGEEPISQDMWEASKQYALRQVFASTDAKMTEQAYLSLKLFSGFEIAVAHKDGAEWQKEQFIKRLCNHANIDKMVEKFEDKYKPEKVLDTEYYKRGIFDTIKTIKEG